MPPVRPVYWSAKPLPEATSPLKDSELPIWCLLPGRTGRNPSIAHALSVKSFVFLGGETPHSATRTRQGQSRHTTNAGEMVVPVLPWVCTPVQSS